jgi:exonuclease III
MHLETWNVQELKNKREIIIKDLEELKLDIIILTETKEKNSGNN